MDKIVLIFKWFEPVHFGKDVFMVIYHLKQLYNLPAEIIYQGKFKKDIPDEYKGVRLKGVEKFLSYKITSLYTIFYLLSEAQKTNLLVRFHHTPITIFLVILYKFLNKNGKTYVKLDMSEDDIPSKTRTVSLTSPLSFFKQIIYRKYFDSLNMATCETHDVFNELKKYSYYGYSYGSKLKLMPNGFDEDKISDLGIIDNMYSEKENLIITVGRIGSYQKNTEFLLNALQNVDLKDWKVVCIGPVETAFYEFLNNYFSQNPNLKNKIVFKGAIKDKRELWEYYNRAKIFVLTSRFEGYPLVFTEARRFNNFIISTPLSAAKDVIHDMGNGVLINHEDVSGLQTLLNDIIENKYNIIINPNKNKDKYSWKEIIGSTFSKF